MKKILQALWPLFAFLTLIAIFAFGLTRDPNILPSEMIDRPMPAFELTELYEPERRLTEDMFTGHISLVNVFGSWCASCVVEHPKLMDISKNQPVKMVGVDWRDTREDAKRWLAKNGNPYDVILFDDDSRLAIDLDAQVIEFMRERYGDYVLLKPPLQRNTALLWFLPAIVIMGMALWFFARVRQRPRPLAPRQPLSADDEITLKRLMDDSS